MRIGINHAFILFFKKLFIKSANVRHYEINNTTKFGMAGKLLFHACVTNLVFKTNFFFLIKNENLPSPSNICGEDSEPANDPQDKFTSELVSCMLDLS